MDYKSIEKIKLNRMPLEKMDIPNLLYKYRSWSKEYHKKALKQPCIYFSAPMDFDDPLDCKNPVRYDLLTEFEIFDYYFQESKKINPLFNYFEHLDWAGHWFIKSPLRDPYQLKDVESKTFKEFNEIFGVFCLTSDPLNSAM